MGYLSDGFIEALEKFEEIVQMSSQDLIRNEYLHVCHGPEDSLTLKQVAALSPGFNKKNSVRVTVIRVLWNRFHTFLLVTETGLAYHSCEFHCIIVETFDLQAPFFGNWKKELGLNTNLVLKEPYIDTEISDMTVFRVCYENIVF